MLLGSPPLDCVAPESTSDATLATAGDTATGSNSYNLRRAPTASLRVRSNDEFLGSSHLSRNYESYSEWLSELNTEFPGSRISLLSFLCFYAMLHASTSLFFIYISGLCL